MEKNCQSISLNRNDNIFPCITVIRSNNNFPSGDGDLKLELPLLWNGWTAVNDANSKWYVGTFAKSLGTRGVYIDVNATAGTANNYNSNINNNRISHFYRDISIRLAQPI
ncbi:MAG: hypothetical protein IPL74_00825 [Bacteroidetes bacterium]|nr:hypothetical protein [Bacteroidota bacterium]